LTSDLLQHSYQTCTLYNACIVSPQEYAAKTDKLQELQLQVRRTLFGAGVGQQQNIQINPPFGAPLPGGVPGQPLPGQSFPGQPFPGPGPQAGATFPPSDPNMPQQPFPAQSNIAQSPSGTQPGGPAIAMTGPSGSGSQTGESILSILREGSKLLRSTSAAPPQPAAPTQQATTQPVGVPSQDLDSALRAMLQSLKQDVAQRSPALANSRAVIGNFTEEGRPWSGPMGALLQERVSTIAMNDRIFSQTTGVQTRGITVKDVQSVSNINDPKSLTTLYNTDLAIAGTYQTRPEGVAVKLTALQKSGEVGEATRIIPANSIPDVVAATPQNANDTNQLIGSLNQVAPRADGQLNLTTNRPGQGSSFRMGEEITYFATSAYDGYLYLFHVDGDKNVNRIFPNQYQADPRIRAGQALQLPGPGAPFKFEASPPFGLETTFAIVTAAPLNDADLQTIQNSFASAKQEAPALLKTRGIAVSPAGPGAPPARSAVLWNSVTVLIRP
jgi:hypothetical protein